MESDTPNNTANQLPVQHISEAAVFTNPGNGIRACHAAAASLFLYNQRDVPDRPISFLAATSSPENSRPYKSFDTDQRITDFDVGFDRQSKMDQQSNQ
jgi:hypothetical protein